MTSVIRNVISVLRMHTESYLDSNSQCGRGRVAKTRMAPWDWAACCCCVMVEAQECTDEPFAAADSFRVLSSAGLHVCTTRPRACPLPKGNGMRGMGKPSLV